MNTKSDFTKAVLAELKTQYDLGLVNAKRYYLATEVAEEQAAANSNMKVYECADLMLSLAGLKMDF